MNDRYGCEAIQCSDQKVCNRCGLIWDMNDLDPPKCLTKLEYQQKKLADLREKLDTK